MSEVKVNKISPRSGTDVTLGDSGDTFTVPTGVTLDTSNSTVTLPDGSVTSAKLNNDIISGATELATEPADTDEFLVSDAGTLKRIDYSLIKGGGITVAGTFRLTTTFQGDSVPITSNLEEVDTDGYSRIGTAITLSSGIFSFPSTGIYLISAQGSFQTESGQSDNYRTLQIKTTTNNSTYGVAAVGWDGGIDSTEYGGTFTQCIFDVTDISTHKVQFAVDSNNAQTYVLGDTNENKTAFTFVRLGDT